MRKMNEYFSRLYLSNIYLADPTADHTHDIEDMFMIISAFSSLIALFETCGFFK